MKQNKSNNPKSSPPPKSNSVFDYAHDMIGFLERPISLRSIEKIAHELLTWVREDENALNLYQFYAKKGLYDMDIQRWRKRCPELDKAVQHAVEIIGVRRDVGSLTRKYDGSYSSKMHGMYSKDYRAYKKWEAELAAKQLNEQNEIPKPHHSSCTCDICTGAIQCRCTDPNCDKRPRLDEPTDLPLDSQD